MEKVNHCSSCRFHVQIENRAHLQHCTKFPDAKGEPRPCVAVRPFECGSGAAYESSSTTQGEQDQ
jgi:hypothetical protein